MVALLGRRDLPTDALEDYCVWLGRALEPRGCALRTARVPWEERGWWGALRWLREQSAGWQAEWVLVQYTALSWSRRGFPVGLLGVLRALGKRRALCAVVFHDAESYSGQRLIDRLRRACQRQVMRLAYRWTALSILTVPFEKVSWLPASPTKAVFIPVGANFPEPSGDAGAAQAPEQSAKTVAVFGVTGGAHALSEVRDIAYAVSRAAQHSPNLRLVVFGRNSEEARAALAQALDGAKVDLSVLGLLPAEEIPRTLSRADALLFVRGHLCSRRSSAIAGIACGLPVVGYAGPETASPITEAGVALAPQGDREALAEALTRVLRDDTYRRELQRRSRAAEREHFSWSVIATRYLQTLGGAHGHA